MTVNLKFIHHSLQLFGKRISYCSATVYLWGTAGHLIGSVFNPEYEETTIPIGGAPEVFIY